MNRILSVAAPSRYRKNLAGFGLVEVMVAMLIGLITTVSVMQIYASFEGAKRTTSGGADAQVNASLGLFTIEREVRNAGYGLTIAAAMNCTVNAYHEDRSPTNFSFNLVPIEIIDGGVNGDPDIIHVLYSSKDSFSLPTAINKNHPPTAANFFVNSVQGIETNDLMIAWEPGKDCSVIQVTNAPDTSGKIVIHNNGLSKWNPPGGANIFPQPDGYKSGAFLFNMGSMVDLRYFVQNGKLVESRFNSANGTFTNTELVDHVVNIQAEYGKDTDANGSVDVWNVVAPANAADWAQVMMVRLAVVAQSAQFEKTDSSGNDVTMADLKWPASEPAASQRTIRVSGLTDWKHFRYRVFETVIPLRNRMWGQPAS